MTDILEDNSQVIGHIYLITHTSADKYYVGQTLSHRKNRGKYRPFGYMGRFHDHISEAVCNTKKKQCTYLNNAIRRYGKDAFQVELIQTCSKEELDTYEQQYIREYNSLYPNGYNLTRGGKVFHERENNIENTTPLQPVNKRGGCTSRSQETRTKMSESLKVIMGTEDARKGQMQRSQDQHQHMKLSKFKGIPIDMNHLDQYIRIRNRKDGSQFIKLVIGKHITQFNGKYETIDELKQKAIEFIKQIKDSATLPNCSGNP
jgi:hypothetical protein